MSVPPYLANKQMLTAREDEVEFII